MAKKKIQEEETLEEALVGVLGEELEEVTESVTEPEPELDPVACLKRLLDDSMKPSRPGTSDPIAWLLAKIDAGKGPIGILTGHSRKAREAILTLDAACGDRIRTLSLDRARLGVAGVEVKAYSAPEQLRGKRLASAWVQPGASQRLVDLLRRCLQKGGEVLG